MAILSISCLIGGTIFLNIIVRPITSRRRNTSLMKNRIGFPPLLLAFTEKSNIKVRESASAISNVQ